MIPLLTIKSQNCFENVIKSRIIIQLNIKIKNETHKHTLLDWIYRKQRPWASVRPAPSANKTIRPRKHPLKERQRDRVGYNVRHEDDFVPSTTLPHPFFDLLPKAGCVCVCVCVAYEQTLVLCLRAAPVQRSH